MNLFRHARWNRWLLAAQGGDRRAFRDLYRELYPDVVRFVARRVGNAADREDIVAIVFHRVVERLDHFDPGRGTVRAWVLTIARNAVIDHVRRRRNHAALDEVVLAEFGCPVERLAADEVSRRVRAWLDGQATELKEMYVLRYGDGLRHREIADVLGLSESAVKQRFSRSLRELRLHLRSMASEVDYAT
ncbi:MAG: sigma-70 family RNA polymerase sigma factor [Myxococcales bacterium FL481]|nr:MAG: sigma-70 family RNA polymerase sigma factor [Myxococcales bacterium FL481]